MTEPTGRIPGADVLPASTREYLRHVSLAPLWDAVRYRLERNGLRATGTLTVELDEVGTDRLGGLLGRRTTSPARLHLADLDAALRRSAAAAGLVTVTEALTGRLVDRKAARAARESARASTAALLDAALADAGVGNHAWVSEFAEGVRVAGILTRAGDSAPSAIAHAGAALRELAAAGVLSPADQSPADPHRRADVNAEWGLAEFATRCTGDAHGLDSGRVAPALVLRAAAAALGVHPPKSARDARELWSRLGVAPDELSGSVMVYSLRPPGNDAWAVMMRARAELGLVTHLTLQELRGPAAGAQWVEVGSTVSVCENPQVLQAAQRAGTSGALVCTSGDPASAGWVLLHSLVARGAWVRYHGDFDWPGMAIAARILATDVVPWRLAAGDYADAVAVARSTDLLPLTGKSIATPWDPQLSTMMSHAGVAVHEEALLMTLLEDLSST